jgi:hypothetical protein
VGGGLPNILYPYANVVQIFLYGLLTGTFCWNDYCTASVGFVCVPNQHGDGVNAYIIQHLVSRIN